MPDPTTQTIEAAIKAQHVLEIDYTDRNGDRTTFEAEPYAFRKSAAGQVELWIWALGPEHWEQLHPDRINSARDTGRTFNWRDLLPLTLQNPE